MSDKPDRQITIPSKGGMFQDLAVRVKLVLRLLMDSRVNPLVKLLPIGSALYLLVPDLAPGPIDDAAIIWLATYLFVELCPPGVVEEHLKDLQAVKDVLSGDAGQAQPVDSEGDIIDAEIIEGESSPDPK